MEQESGPDADGDTIHGGNHGLLRSRERLEKRNGIAGPSRCSVGKIHQIVARGEAVACARKKDHANGAVCFRGAEAFGHAPVHRLRERVLLFRPADANGNDAGMGLNDDVV